MTFEEWETYYIKNRPIEPNSSSENPEQWSEIAEYAEGRLREAYAIGAAHKAEEIAENLNGTTSFENYKRLRELEKKAQVYEKLRNCGNCKHRLVRAVADIMEIDDDEPCLSCVKLDKWEIK